VNQRSEEREVEVGQWTRRTRIYTPKKKTSHFPPIP
jgi:hypothetical protein